MNLFNAANLCTPPAPLPAPAWSDPDKWNDTVSRPLPGNIYPYCNTKQVQSCQYMIEMMAAPAAPGESIGMMRPVFRITVHVLPPGQRAQNGVTLQTLYKP